MTTSLAVVGGAGTAGATDRTLPAAHHGARFVIGSSHGVEVKSVKVVDSRQLLATIVPKALGRAITVRILLPVDYQPEAKPGYPVLYLYPGTSGHSYDWMTVGDAPKTTAPYRLITVSSDIGFNGDGGGWFTNWVDTKTALGPSQWETYDIDELIPWIDSNFDTIRSRAGRAVAGLSQGGYGSTELAARHPDLFVMDGSFSGAPEINRDVLVRAGAYGVIAATMSGLNGVEPDAPFGNPITDQINWQGHDPATTVENLRPVRLWLATADGLPGKYDDPVTNPPGYLGAAAVESATHESTDYFLQHVRAAHIPSYVYDYGSGTHTWPYWARDFRHFIKPLMQTFAHPPARPDKISYKTIEPTYAVWGWHVSIKRSQRLAFSTLKVGPRGFVLSGTGVATVVSPSGRHYRLALRAPIKKSSR
ncbi:MAG TPA: alpha/beta hydrolase family protein [Mycobacteriales bacterium]|nr:alpha/beta hydrolase family protein [Mycobacteriales bacterium]